ncbi:toxin-antitoxin system HicB family antitoxin [Streptomyces sp. NPDC059597]|uniref:toxin-antitoxin system HicB family antitoxin n=1 Tax=Streptomyces sp. NPDC059597 TaxID=3346879 RepID=UPI0036AEA971
MRRIHPEPAHGPIIATQWDQCQNGTMTKHVNLRLPDDVHAAAVVAAAADDRSLNSWLISVVRRAAQPSGTPDRPDGDPATPASLRRTGNSPRP